MNHSTDEEALGTSCKILGRTYFVISKLPSEKFVINYIFAISFNGLLIIPTILLNAVATITILKSSQLKSKPCYFIILVQSVIDLAVGVLGIPLLIFFLASGMGGITNCVAARLTLSSTLLPAILSSVTLSALTLERYIAILHPYAYSTQVTKKRLLIYVGCGPVVAISLLLLYLSNPRLYHICVATVEMFIFVFTAFAYTRIYLVVKKLSRTPNRPHDPAAVDNTTKMKVFWQKVAHAKSCFIVVICFGVFCVLPGGITIAFFPTLNLFEKQAILVWIITLGLINSSVNSIIFFWTIARRTYILIKILAISVMYNESETLKWQTLSICLLTMNSSETLSMSVCNMCV